ncbi:hypothetical protein DL98DRAFT_597406 [Cadophora sp. DSE1049]|nr:hypothetical protein DL98DRAFT_597406 [Cadophora sp. DSE1049]
MSHSNQAATDLVPSNTMSVPTTTTDGAFASTKTITIQEVEIYATALSYLKDDYNILIIEFDKDRDYTIKTYAAVGLHKMDRIFEFEDKVKELKKAVMKREDRVAQGKNLKASHFDKERGSLASVDDDFNRLREDMQRLRADLEGSEGHVYGDTAARFKIIRTQPTGGKSPPKKPVEDKAKTKPPSQDTTTTSSSNKSHIPSAITTFASGTVTPLEASSTKPISSDSKKKRRKRSATKYEDGEEATGRRNTFLDSSSGQAAQSEEEYVTTKSFKARSNTNCYCIHLSAKCQV